MPEMIMRLIATLKVSFGVLNSKLFTIVFFRRRIIVKLPSHDLRELTLNILFKSDQLNGRKWFKNSCQEIVD